MFEVLTFELASSPATPSSIMDVPVAANVLGTIGAVRIMPHSVP